MEVLELTGKTYTPIEPPSLGEMLKSPEVLTQLAWASFSANKVEQALRLAQTGIEQNPCEIRAHQILGYIYQRTGHTEKARREWDIIKSLYATPKDS